MSLRLELDEETLLDLAQKIAERLPQQASGTPTWMNFEELVAYTRIPEGTLRKLTAARTIRSHSSGRVRIYHRDEVDEDLLGYSREKKPTELRRIA